MRKNGSRLISLGRYRTTDLFLFAVLLVVFDLLSHYAIILLPAGAGYVFALTVPMTVLVMMRWGWWSAFFAVGDAIVLTLINNPSSWQTYLSYGIGGASMLLLLIPLRFIDKQKIAKKWYFTALFFLTAWFLDNFVCSLVQLICGVKFAVALSTNFGFGLNGMLSLAIGMVLLMVLRKLDGMFEDQIQYLKRIDRERKEMMRRDEFGDEPIEIDEETISILNRRDEEL